jgi:hypothetical protein
MPGAVCATTPPNMKSCLGLLFIISVFTLVIGGSALIWYLSDTSDFSRNGPPPKAVPVRSTGS